MARGRQSKADKEAVLADFNAGVHLKDIAKKHGCSTALIDKWRVEAGLPSRRQANRGKGKTASRDALTGGRWVKDQRGVSHWVSG